MQNITIAGEKINYEDIKNYYRHSIGVAFKNLFSSEQLSTILENAFNDLLLHTYDTERELSDHLFALLFIETDKIKHNIAAKQISSLKTCYDHFAQFSVEIKQAIALSGDHITYAWALEELNDYKFSLLIKGEEDTAELVEGIYAGCERKFLGIPENTEMST
jgi:hypothetical protein